MQDWLSSSLVQHSSGSAAAVTASRATMATTFMYRMNSYCRMGDYTNKLMSMNRERSTSPSLAAKIVRLEESFRQAFMSQGEPLGYCNTLIQSVNGQRFDSPEEEYKYKMYSFADEINLIKQGESFPQALKKLVGEREEAIRQLRAELISNRSSKQLNLSTACERLDNLRMYSLLIIEKVANCKRKLQVHDSPYFSQILQKLGQDVDFLRLSGLRKFIEFSNHNDPLFMVPLRKFWNMEVAADCHRRPIIDLFTLDADYHKRLEAADRFIKNTEKVDGTTQEMLNEIDSRSIIEKAIEQSQKSGEGREQYISTLQKFTLPSLRSRQKTEQAYTSVKTKEVVSNLIKEVISEYKMRGKEKSVSNYYDKKKRLLSRSIERPREALPSRQSLKEKIDTRPNNIRYKMGKAASLKSNGLQRQYYQQKQEYHEEQSRGRLIRYTKRLPQLQKQEREEYSSEKINEFQKYLLNQQYDNSSNPSSKHIDFRSMRANEIELGRLRELPGKIRFNQLGSKMHTEPVEQLRYDISNRIDRANDNKMSNNHSMKNSSLIEHNPTFRARDLPNQQERMTTPSPSHKNDASSTHQLKEKSQRNHPPPQSPSNETEPVKSARSCWISQQFSYHQIVNNLSASPDYNNSQAQSPSAFHKTAQLRRATEEKPKNLRINFQFNQQIYSPPFVPHMKIAIPNDEEQKIKYEEKRRQVKQAEMSRRVNQEKKESINMSTPEHEERIVVSEAKEISIPPFSIRQMASSAERYDVDRIEEEIQAQNGTSQRTSENMSQKVEEHPHKNNALKQSEIKQILEESQSSMDNRSNKASVRLQNRSNRSSVKEEEKSSNPPENRQAKMSSNSLVKQLENSKNNIMSGKLENNSSQPQMQPIQLDNKSNHKAPVQMEHNSSNNSKVQVDNKSSNNASIQVNFSPPKKNQNSMTEPIPQQATTAKPSGSSNLQISFKKERPAIDVTTQQAKPEYEFPQREESSSLSFYPPEKSQILPNYGQDQSPYLIQRPRQLSIDNASNKSSLIIKPNGFPIDKPQQTAQKISTVAKPEYNAQKTVPAEEKKPAQQQQTTNAKTQQPKPAFTQQPKPAQSLQSKNEASKATSPPMSMPIKTVQSQPLKKQQPKQLSQVQTKPVIVQQVKRQQKSEALLQKQDERQSNPSNLLQTMPMINSENSIAHQEKPLQKPMSNEKMAQMLQKCAFQSKQIKHQDLISQLAKLSPSKSQTLKQIIDQSYFAYRQIYVTNCLFDGQVCCYCLYYPQLSPNARTIFILHIQLVKQKFAPLQVALYNTFIKYIFINDPCESIICINYNNLVNKNVVRQLKNFQKEIPTPLVADKVSEMAYLLARKDIQCAKEEELTSILTFINTFATTKVNNQIVPGNDAKITYGANYLKKVSKKIVKQNKSYSINQLNAYLTQQELPKFKTLKPTTQLFFTKYIVEQCFLQSKFFVYSKDFYFTIDYPHTCLFQGKNAFFLVIATSIKGKYFIFADKLYEEEINLAQAYRAEIEGKEFDSLFNSHKSKGKIVTCPTFRKQVESTLGETAVLLSVELNWKDYLKGVRYIQEDWIHLELVCPFFFGFAQLDEQKRFQLLCRTTIQQTHLIK